MLINLIWFYYASLVPMFFKFFEHVMLSDSCYSIVYIL